MQNLQTKLSNTQIALSNAINTLTGDLHRQQHQLDELGQCLINASVNYVGNGSTVYFTGIGKNETIALKTANMFRSLQYDAHKLCPVNSMHGDMGLLRDQDTIIAISKSGNTSELIHFLRYVKQTKPSIKIFGVCVGNINSKFHVLCDHVIELPYVDECNELNAPTNSIILTQIFFDAVATDLPLITDSQFRESHPGGTIGGVD